MVWVLQPLKTTLVEFEIFTSNPGTLPCEQFTKDKIWGTAGPTAALNAFLQMSPPGEFVATWLGWFIQGFSIIFDPEVWPKDSRTRFFGGKTQPDEISDDCCWSFSWKLLKPYTYWTTLGALLNLQGCRDAVLIQLLWWNIWKSMSNQLPNCNLIDSSFWGRGRFEATWCELVVWFGCGHGLTNENPGWIVVESSHVS